MATSRWYSKELNRPENLTPLTHEEHQQRHHESDEFRGEVWYSERNLHHLYSEKDMTQEEIAKKFGVSQRAVSHHMDSNGVNTRNL
jgi:DNA-directed RNA polymerase specialized sigma subunit